MQWKVAPGSLAVNEKVAELLGVEAAGPVIVVSGPFLSSKTWTRLLAESVTRMRPVESIAIPSGTLNCPVSRPIATPPSFERNAPAVVNRWSRLCPLSTTQTVPSASMARSLGPERPPSPLPELPHFARNVPVGLNFWMRLFPLSATHTFPDPSIAIPFGALKLPSSVPNTPHLRRNDAGR